MFAYVSGGGWMLLTGVAMVDQLWPPFVDASTAMLTQQKPFFGLKFVSVV